MESTPPLIHVQPFVHIHFLCSTSLSSTSISSIIRRCHNIFMSAPTVALRRINNLSNVLARAKRHHPSQNTIPLRLFSMRQPFFNVHTHMKRAYVLHIPFHRRRKTYYSPRYLQLVKPCLRHLVRTLSNDIFLVCI